MAYSVRVNPADPSNYDTSRRPIKKIIIHHAAGTNFDAIANTFKNPARDASAHYAVGQNNNVDFMVPEQYTAWHYGNYPVNQESIGIEHVNSGGAPGWPVADSTKNTSVELCIDIVRRNPGIGKLVPGVNLFGHKQVASPQKPTACPVTLIAWLQELADKVNAATGQGGGSAPAPQPGRKSNDQVANEVIAGLWGNGDDRRNRLAQAGYDYGTVQGIVNQKLAGGSSVPARKSNETIAQEVWAGHWGNGTDRQRRLQAAGYDYNAIQAIVNRGAGGGAPAPGRKSNDTIAREVVRGDWGNGSERRRRLTQAGYDYNAIQAIVNRLV